ncbi:MAG: hypothetical protein GY820_46640 [Gammaproteobacteria bacterium]|nr:hypothetical protein [Gammaproteobacteria bacterium]
MTLALKVKVAARGQHRPTMLTDAQPALLRQAYPCSYGEREQGYAGVVKPAE